MLCSPTHQDRDRVNVRQINNRHVCYSALHSAMDVNNCFEPKGWLIYNRYEENVRGKGRRPKNLPPLSEGVGDPLARVDFKSN